MRFVHVHVYKYIHTNIHMHTNTQFLWVAYPERAVPDAEAVERLNGGGGLGGGVLEMEGVSLEMDG